MKTLKGPAIFLAQFLSDTAPFNSLDSIAGWVASLGFKGVQIPTWDKRVFDLEQAANSTEYCTQFLATLAKHGLVPTELSTHLQGQLVAVHPAYDEMFDGFAPESVRGNPTARQAWAVEQLLLAAKASKNLGLKAHATFSGALLWPYLYPWPQRPAGLVDAGFGELAKRWKPILDAFDAVGDLGKKFATEIQVQDRRLFLSLHSVAGAGATFAVVRAGAGFVGLNILIGAYGLFDTQPRAVSRKDCR